MNKIGVALILAAAVLLGPAAGVSVAKPGHGGGPHIGHPGYGGGAFRMHRGGGVPGYRGPGRNWAYGSGNFRRHRGYGYGYGYGYGGFYPYYYGGYGGCGWLYAQAAANGSSYWWQRYYECVGY
ncbi:MAG: hypothetical protein ACXWJS_01620 [Hyphomicrobium sp.]|jgi:hypothetical protein